MIIEISSAVIFLPFPQFNPRMLKQSSLELHIGDFTSSLLYFSSLEPEIIIQSVALRLMQNITGGISVHEESRTKEEELRGPVVLF